MLGGNRISLRPKRYVNWSEAVAEVQGDHSVRWGLTASDVAIILREDRPHIRSGALDVLADWLRADDEAVEDKWRLIIGPFFEMVWPKERVFREASLTAHWIDIVVGAGDEFPAALEQLQPFMVPYRRGITESWV